MTDDNIRRLIKNQGCQYTPHAFKGGGPGLEDFNELHPILRNMPVASLAGWMSLIDEMRATHKGCVACSCKILAYSVLFTADRLPALAAEYSQLYSEQVKDSRENRDYMREIRDSLPRPDAPA